MKCPRCHNDSVRSAAEDDWYCNHVFCGWESDEPPVENND